MGQAKREWEEALARGFHDVGDKFVCEACFGDYAVKEIIRQNATAKDCDYCGRGSEDSDVCVAPIDKVMAIIVEGVEQEWAEPTADGVGWISSEGGWQSRVYDTWELFDGYIKDELEIDGGDLLDDIIESVGDKQWCQKDHLLLPPGKAMVYGWERFSQAVKHETRYMFLGHPEDEVSYRSPDELRPSEIPRLIGECLQETGLMRTIPEGSRFFRAREHNESEIYTTARDLGPPPCESARSNRMSPAGIPMFYGAADAETAIAETDGEKTGGIVTVGAFDTVKALTMLDFHNIPLFPSLFDRHRRHLRGLHSFLCDFVIDLSRPIEKDGRQHTDYVPTQIITEYLHQQFRTADGQRVHGILYSSSRREGGRCCVLFCSQENCTEKPHDSWRKADQWLRFDPTSVTRLKGKTG